LTQEGDRRASVGDFPAQRDFAKVALGFARAVEIKPQGGNPRSRQGARALDEDPMRLHAIAGEAMKHRDRRHASVRRPGRPMQHTAQCLARAVGKLHKTLDTGTLHSIMTSRRSDHPIYQSRQ